MRRAVRCINGRSDAAAAQITLSGQRTDLVINDHNAILSGVTLERQVLGMMHLPREQSAALGSLGLAQGVTSGALRGGEPGKGGDFSGTFIYAVNVGPQVRSQLTALN